MASVLSLDGPTADACPACDGERTVHVEQPGGEMRREPCSWCEGCGFVGLERLAEWHARKPHHIGRDPG